MKSICFLQVYAKSGELETIYISKSIQATKSGSVPGPNAFNSLSQGVSTTQRRRLVTTQILNAWSDECLDCIDLMRHMICSKICRFSLIGSYWIQKIRRVTMSEIPCTVRVLISVHLANDDINRVLLKSRCKWSYKHPQIIKINNIKTTKYIR